VIIYSNSSNTIALFNSLHAPNSHINRLLMTAVDILLKEFLQLCVLHIHDEQNHVPDALSC
ncbi:hypothetical protein BDQ17DRAFT_1242029, partial [Cyathus striatus]